MNSDEFRTYGAKVIDWIAQYFKDVGLRSVIPHEECGYLVYQIEENAPEKPIPFSATLADFDRLIMPGLVHWTHPHFHAYFATGDAFVNILAEALSTATAAVNFSWYSNPVGTEMETLMLDWMAKALGLPEKFMSDKSNFEGGGCLNGSASECIFVATMTARHQMIKFMKDENNDLHESNYLSRLVAYSCDQAHSAVEKAATMALLQMRILPSDANGQMDIPLLKKTIKEDIERGLLPCLVVATTGTTGLASFDDVDAIQKEVRALESKMRHPIWIHVDGAYGGAFFLTNRDYVRGFENVNSFNFNPTKELLTAFDCSCLWTDDVKALKEGLTIDPFYLKTNYTSKRQIDYRHYGVALSRRFRSLKLWFLFQNYGLKGLRAHVNNLCDCAVYLKMLVKEDPRFEIINQVKASMVCIAYKTNPILDEDKANRKTRKLIDLLNETRAIHLIGHHFKNRYLIRIPINYNHTTKAIVDKSWAIIQDTANRLDKDPELGNTSNTDLFLNLTREQFEVYEQDPHLMDGWSSVICCEEETS